MAGVDQDCGGYVVGACVGEGVWVVILLVEFRMRFAFLGGFVVDVDRRFWGQVAVCLLDLVF